ncbi:hypothetical protein M3Y97_00628100 [Aphelenchoides bicaudatus]|nr:hypothetical protein M3Y97_00628100 [Aphelenchoides bicaudatus]
MILFRSRRKHLRRQRKKDIVMAGGDILIDYFFAQQEDPNEEPPSSSVQRDDSVDRTFEAINYDLLSKEPINIGMRNGKIVIIDDEDGDELKSESPNKLPKDSKWRRFKKWFYCSSLTSE